MSMLAQTFKTAQELDLQEDLYAAFVELLRMLESGEMEHVPTRNRQSSMTILVHDRPRPCLFNMNYWANDIEGCGTVMCIGGSTEALMGRYLSEKDYALHGLFYPSLDIPGDYYETINAAHAARTLRRYLETGEIQW